VEPEAQGLAPELLLADLPVIHFAYTNMEAFGSGLGTLIANRWRGDPNDGFRNVTTGADFADFAIEVPTMVGGEGGSCQILHYSQILSLPAENRLYAVRS